MNESILSLFLRCSVLYRHLFVDYSLTDILMFLKQCISDLSFSPDHQGAYTLDKPHSVRDSSAEPLIGNTFCPFLLLNFETESM